MKRLIMSVWTLIISIFIGSLCLYAQESDVVFEGDSAQKYSVYGYENESIRCNIAIDKETKRGEFAIVYLENPNCVYEFVFEASDIEVDESTLTWDEVEKYCMENKTKWKAIDINIGNEKVPLFWDFFKKYVLIGVVFVLICFIGIKKYFTPQDNN